MIFSQNDYQNEKKKGQITKKPLNISMLRGGVKIEFFRIEPQKALRLIYECSL